jgi:hypothetical protein
MSARGLALAALCSGALACPAANAQPAGARGAAALPAGAFRVEVAEVVDATGFGKPMVAARVLVPAGWQARGGIQWANRPCQEPASFAWSAAAPDGSAGVDLFPAVTWAAGSNGSGDCMPGNFDSVRAFLEAHVRSRIPDAEVLDYRARPDFLDTSKDYYDELVKIVNGSRTGMRAAVDAGEILYSFRRDDAPMRGLAAAVVVFYASELPNPLGGPPFWQRTGGTSGVFGAYARDGQLDFKRVEAVRKSVKPDVEWLTELFKLKERIAEVNVAGTRQRAAMIVAGGAAMTRATIEANQLASRNYADVSARSGPSSSGSSTTSATDDRLQRERIEVIRGVETYHDPVEGGTVQLDNTYDHAWRVNNDKAYILTDDPNFNPGLFDIDAEPLRVVQ